MIEMIYYGICVLVIYRFNKDLHESPFPKTKIIEVWSSDNNKVDEDGGPYYVEIEVLNGTTK